MAEKRPREDSHTHSTVATGGGAAAAGGSAASATAAAVNRAQGSGVDVAGSFDQSSLDGVLALIRTLRTETGENAFMGALNTIRKMLSNVMHHPTEKKYRYIRLRNSHFHSRLGRYPAGVALLKAFGFEDAVEIPNGNAEAATPTHASVGKAVLATHLALPIADVAQLAPGLVLLEAARQASLLASGSENLDVGGDSSKKPRLEQMPAAAEEPPEDPPGTSGSPSSARHGLMHAP